MKKLLLVCYLAFQGSISFFAQCEHCESFEEALKNPLLVKELDLSMEGLLEIPAELVKFENLEILDLSFNAIEKSKFNFASLKKLTRLNLKNNPKLDLFSLDASFFSLNLKELNLSNCNLIFIPEEFGNFNEMKNLDLSLNFIRLIPQSFENLKQLTFLNLSNNNLINENTFLSSLWNLEFLDVSSNPSLDFNILLIYLQNKRVLHELVVSQTNSSSFQNNLTSLFITKLVIRDATVETISENIKLIPTLKEIDFDNCNFTNANLLYKQLNEIKQIEHLSFQNSKINGQLKNINSVKQIVLLDDVLASDLELDSKNLPIFMNSMSEDSIQKISQNAENPLFSFSQKMKENRVEKIVDVPIKKFIVQADTPCEIKNENTRFEIPSSAFLTADNQVYKGQVSIELKEYFDPISIALAGSPMVMNNNGTAELFSSNGMFEFKAFDSKRNELKPNPANEIQVEMKNLQPEQNTSLFNYNDSTKNWQKLQANLNPPSPNLRQQILDSLKQLPDSLFSQFQSVHVPFNILYKEKKGKEKAFSEIGKYRLNFFFGESNYYSNVNKDFFKKKSSVFLSKDKHLLHLKNASVIIDTILFPEHKSLLKAIKTDSSNSIIDLKNKYERYYVFYPRNYSNLSITPDYKNDYFLLNFDFEGKSYSLPLIIDNDKRLKDYQKLNADFYRKYLKSEKQNKLELEKAKNYFNENKEKFAELNRSLRAAEIFNSRITGNIFIRKNELLRFGLTKFGLTNCDYFERNPPSRYIVFSDSMKDQEGKKFRTPYSTRIILLGNKTYIESNSNEVPDYFAKRTVMFFLMSSIEIAVIKSWEKLKNGLFIPIVEIFSIEGLTEKEIRNKILH